MCPFRRRHEARRYPPRHPADLYRHCRKEHRPRIAVYVRRAGHQCGEGAYPQFCKVDAVEPDGEIVNNVISKSGGE